MEMFSNLALGFQAALSVETLLFCFIGVTIGTFIGVLPGIGPLAVIAMALPLTFKIEPASALIMLAGIFYGSQYGGSVASILLKMPGTPSAAATCLDGYPLAQKGRAGLALFTAMFSSFVGGSIALLLLMAFAPLLASIALKFGAAEYFAIMALGLVAASTISVGSPLKGLAMVVLGIVIGLSGMDVSTGYERFTFGSWGLMEGVNLVALAMGIFGVAEIFTNVGRQARREIRENIGLKALLPSRTDLKSMLPASLRGGTTGSVIGALPGAGPAIASFIGYAVEKRVAKEPERFGQGAVEGVAGPEAANNSAVQASFIPTLSLGIPGDAIMAVLMGAMLIHGIIPGPLFIVEHSTLFWTLVASFWIGNVLLLILNIPLIGIWVRMLSIPYHVLYPAMLVFICFGVYSFNNSVFDVYLLLGFSVLGYLMLKFGFPAAPLLLGFILGPMIEEQFRRALLLSGGEFDIFVQRPISAVILAATALLLIFSMMPAMKFAGQRVKLILAPRPR